MKSGLIKLHLEGKGTGVDLEVIVGICYVQTPETIVMIQRTHTPESSSKYERQFDRIVQSFPAI